MAIKTLFTGSTSGVLYTDRRDFYLKPKSFAELFPNVSPFITFLMKANFRTGLADPVFKLFEHQAPWQRQIMVNNGSSVSIGVAATGASTESSAVTFDGFVGFSAATAAIDTSFVHTMWEVWDTTGTTKRGVCLLTDDTSTTTAKFRNLSEDGGAIATVDNDIFVYIGNAQEEGATSPGAWADELAVVWNQCQIFRTPIEITGTLAQASLRGANKELARLRAQKMANHKIGMEKSLLWGDAPLGCGFSNGSTSFSDLDKLVGDTSKVVRTTTGLARAIELYGDTTGTYKGNFTLNNTMTYSDLVDILEVVFQYVPISGVKDTFTGAGALGWWSKRAMEKNSGFVINQNSAERNIAGQKVRTLITPHGDLNLVLTHSFKFEHKDQMLIADPTNLEYVQYRPTKFAANIKTDDGFDGVKDEYFSDVGCGITNIRSHQLLTITG